MRQNESLLLAIDTAAKACSAAVGQGDRILAEISLCTGHTHAAALTGCIKTVLDRAQVKPADLDAIACTVGPGSFTGLRIGLATAKGMALPLGLSILPLSTLSALAEPWLFLGLPVATLLDARSGRLFAGIFQQGADGQVKSLLAPCQTHCHDILPLLPEHLLAVGDGASVLAGYLADRTEVDWVDFGRPRPTMQVIADSRVRPAGVLAAARRSLEEQGEKALLSPAAAKIDYLALSQAERLSGIQVTK